MADGYIAAAGCLQPVRDSLKLADVRTSAVQNCPDCALLSAMGIHQLMPNKIAGLSNAVRHYPAGKTNRRRPAFINESSLFVAAAHVDLAGGIVLRTDGRPEDHYLGRMAKDPNSHVINVESGTVDSITCADDLMD
jgi:hypothetical protein